MAPMGQWGNQTSSESTARISDGAAAGYEVKAYSIRGYVAAIQRMGFLPDVIARMPADIRANIVSLPPATQWIDGGYMNDLLRVVVDVRGADVVRPLVREAMNTSVVPFVKSITQGLLRLFGASPAALFARTQLIVSANLRNVEFTYTPLSDRSGSMEVRFTRAQNVPLPTFIGCAAAFEITLELCGVTGVVQDPVRVPEPAANAARFRIDWW
jgi:hypothetical protein